ncbi:MAG: hypothetical protein AAF216_01670 [Pseudomonadota bacterium]
MGNLRLLLANRSGELIKVQKSARLAPVGAKTKRRAGLSDRVELGAGSGDFKSKGPAMTRLQDDECFKLRQGSLRVNSERNDLDAEEKRRLAEISEFERLIQSNEDEIQRANFEIISCRQPSIQSRQKRRLEDFVLDGGDLLRCLDNARRLNRRIEELRAGIQELERRIRVTHQQLASVRHEIDQRKRLQDQYRDRMRDHGCPISL